MSKHTAGPWKVQMDYSFLNVEDKFKNCIARIKSGEMTHNFCLDEQQANGRLIAAAPELLAALKVMADFHWTKIKDDPNHGYSAYAQDQVELAISIVAKAEGK